MRWTNWRLLATADEWCDDRCDWTGPACYELGTGGSRGGRIRIHYVGETANELTRMRSYARNGSHLGQIIEDHLGDGWYLYYRAISCDSKRCAKELQDRLLARHAYDWNIRLNR